MSKRKRKPAPTATSTWIGDLEIVRWRYDDGGRAGWVRAFQLQGKFRPKSNKDCVTRAIAIATGMPYEVIWRDLLEWSATERRSKRKDGQSHPDDGMYKGTTRRYLERVWHAKWTPTMFIGSGCLMHVRRDELPSEGRHVLRLTKHMAAWIDGVLRDTHDCSRMGTRCVYGYWTLPE